MYYTFGILLFLMGVLAAPSLLLAKKPELKPKLDKLVPYQGWMGVIGALWGIWGIITFVLNLSAFTSGSKFFLIMFLATVVTMTGLGILLGTGTAKTFVKDATAQQKMDDMVTKLQPYQAKLGLAGMVVGVLCIVSMVL